MTTYPLSWHFLPCKRWQKVNIIGVLTSVSNRLGQGHFSGQRDRSSFIVAGQRDNGTSSKFCHGTCQAGTASQNPGLDVCRDNSYFSVKIQDGMREGTGQSLFIFAMNSCFITSIPILQQTFSVSGHLLLPLSRDKGTPGQENLFVPGQRDNGMSLPSLSLDLPFRRNAGTYPPLLINVVCERPLNIERLDRRAEGEIACYGDKAEITECSKNSEMYCFSCCETIELATQYSHREIRLHFFPTLKTFLGSPLSQTSVVLTDRKRTVHFWVGLHFYCIADFVASWLRWLQMFSNDPKWFHLTY